MPSKCLDGSISSNLPLCGTTDTGLSPQRQKNGIGIISLDQFLHENKKV